MASWLLAFPPSLLEHVLLQLDDKDYFRLSFTCKTFSSTCQQEALLLRRILLGHPKRICFKGSWKSTFVSGIKVKASFSTPKTPVELGSLYHRRLQYRCNWVPDKTILTSRGGAVAVCHANGNRLEQPGLGSGPEVWTGLMKSWSTDKWRHPEHWQPHLETDFRVAKPSGGSCFMTLVDYLAYARAQRDEEPLYIFDESFGKRAPALVRDYDVPQGTSEDLFEVLTEGRPDFRWLVMGPQRSGSTWHQDPSGTFAWNALVAGQKRWFFYPPHITPPGVQVVADESGDQEVRSPNPVTWMLEVLPTLPPEMQPIEHLQQPGEVVFLPSRWWHFILNVEDTIAVTQNYVPHHGLEATVRDLAWGSAAHPSRPPDEEATPPQPGGPATRASGGPGVGALAEPEEDAPPAVDRLALTDSGECSLLEEVGPPTSMGLETGFRRSKHLGRWLQTLALKKPDLLPEVVSLASKYADLQHWRELVAGVCTQLKLQEPLLLDCFPISGGPTVIFRVHGDVIIKFYTREPQVAALDAFCELSALQTLQASLGAGASFLPCPILSSAPSPAHFAEIAAGVQPRSPRTLCTRLGALDWLAMVACPGKMIRSTGDPTATLAAALGGTVATLHSAHASGNRGETRGTRRVDDRPAEAAREEVTWEGRSCRVEDADTKAVTRACTVGSHAASPLAERSDSERGLMHDASASLGWFFKDEDAWVEAVEAAEKPWEGCSPWDPFLGFLRRRRREVHDSMFADAALPRHLLAELDTFFPETVEEMVGPFAHETPKLLHGDLSPGNILVGGRTDSKEEGVPPRIALIDFGDAGFGDPLFDLPPLHFLTFRGDEQLTRAFLAGYLQHFPGSQPFFSAHGSAQISHRALWYTLLHEQDILSSVFERRPELWDAASLADLQAELWGFLDSLAPPC